VFRRVLLALPFGFLCGFIGSMPLAGPIALLVFGRGVRGAFRSGLAIALGSAIAESGYAFLAYWGVGELLSRHSELVLASRGLASVILGGLGLYFTFHPASAGGAGESPPVRSSFVLGFGITALNPTFIATWTLAVTLLHSTALLPPTLVAAAPFAVGVGLGIFSWFALMLELMHRYRSRFQARTLDRILQTVGVVLLGTGLWGAVVFVRAVVS
jgi:threonine/homoserine/homoserine lactone efflux protein